MRLADEAATVADVSKIYLMLCGAGLLQHPASLAEPHLHQHIAKRRAELMKDAMEIPCRNPVSCGYPAGIETGIAEICV